MPSEKLFQFKLQIQGRARATSAQALETLIKRNLSISMMMQDSIDDMTITTEETKDEIESFQADLEKLRGLAQ